MAEAEAEGDVLVTLAAERVEALEAAELARDVEVAEATFDETEAITELVEATKLELAAADEVEADETEADETAAEDELPGAVAVEAAEDPPPLEAPAPRQLESELP